MAGKVVYWVMDAKGLHCSGCGHRVRVSWRWCPKCGEAVDNSCPPSAAAKVAEEAKTAPKRATVSACPCALEAKGV